MNSKSEILEIKDFFIKENINKIPLDEFSTNKQQIQSKLETKWNKLFEASLNGITFFLSYASAHFTPTHYQLILSHFEELGQSFLKGPLSLSTPIFFSKEIANSIYYVAKKALMDEQFTASYQLFYLLSILTPECFDSWIGFGLVCQQIKHHDEAILAFAEAKRLSPQSVLPYLYTAESYYELKNWQLAKESCEEGLKFASKEQKHLYEALKALLHQANKK